MSSLCRNNDKEEETALKEANNPAWNVAGCPPLSRFLKLRPAEEDAVASVSAYLLFMVLIIYGFDLFLICLRYVYLHLKLQLSMQIPI